MAYPRFEFTPAASVSALAENLFTDLFKKYPKPMRDDMVVDLKSKTITLLLHPVRRYADPIEYCDFQTAICNVMIKIARNFPALSTVSAHEDGITWSFNPRRESLKSKANLKFNEIANILNLIKEIELHEILSKMMEKYPDQFILDLDQKQVTFRNTNRDEDGEAVNDALLACRKIDLDIGYYSDSYRTTLHFQSSVKASSFLNTFLKRHDLLEEQELQARLSKIIERYPFNFALNEEKMQVTFLASHKEEYNAEVIDIFSKCRSIIRFGIKYCTIENCSTVDRITQDTRVVLTFKSSFLATSFHNAFIHNTLMQLQRKTTIDLEPSHKSRGRKPGGCTVS